MSQSVSEMSPKTKAARKKTQAAFNRTPTAKKKRSADGTARKKLGLKKGSKMDASRSGGSFKAESRSSNRARGGRMGSRAGIAQGGRNSNRKGVKNR